MLTVVGNLGVSGGIGFLIGIAAVWWIAPTTSEGRALLLIICVVASMVLGGIFAHLFGPKKGAGGG